MQAKSHARSTKCSNTQLLEEVVDLVVEAISPALAVAPEGYQAVSLEVSLEVCKMADQAVDPAISGQVAQEGTRNREVVPLQPRLFMRLMKNLATWSSSMHQPRFRHKLQQ